MYDLYYPPKPKSKLEEYNKKLKERELYTNNILDRFIENGSGAPKHDKNGNLMAKRRKFLEESEDFSNIQNIESASIKQNNTNNNNISTNTTNTNSLLYQSFNKSKNNINYKINPNANDLNNNNIIDQTNRRYNNNILNNNNLINTLNQNQLNQINKNQNNTNINRSTPNNINTNNFNQNRKKNSIEEENKNINLSNNYSRKNRYNNYGEEDPFDNDYKGLGILPRNSDDDKVKKLLREEALKAELKKDIEERKLKKEMEKQKQMELDLKEDLKVQKAIEEEKALLKLEKRKKEEYEAQINKANMLKSQNNKPKKKLIDIDEYYNKDIKFKKPNISKEANNQNSDSNNNSNSNQNLNNNEEKNNNNQNGENNNQNGENNNISNNVNINNNVNNTYDFRVNAFQNMRKIRQETVRDINNFNINVNMQNNDEDNENIDVQIKKLRDDVRNQYLEMNDLFHQLKLDVDDAQQYKTRKERESKIIKKELFQNQMAYELSKNILQRNYEDNMNLNYDELINKNINSIDSNTNLQGTSNFVYFDKESNNENNKNNMNSTGGMSSLAMAGKNVIELKGENELIPINNVENEIDMNDMNEMDINKLDLMNEERKNEDENDKKGIMLFKQELERDKLLYEEPDKKCTMEDLYKELNAIENINQTLSPINKIQTLKNNFDVDYGGDYRKKEKQKSKYKFLK